jgi:phosphoglycolate phosphatase
MIKAVLFDLDGTLLDSAPDLVASLNQLRANIDLAPMPVASLRQFVTRGALGMIAAGMPGCDEKTLSQWRDTFLRHYAENSFVNTRPFDGVESLLSVLKSNGIPWGIVTNKLEYLTLPIIEKAGWSSSASAVICGDTVHYSKPHPEPVLAACQLIGADPAHTLMVGDDERDVEAGLQAGCLTALAMYGYAAHECRSEIIENTPRINSPLEVLELLEPFGVAC